MSGFLALGRVVSFHLSPDDMFLRSKFVSVYRRLSGTRWYLGRGSQKILSRPGLTENAILAGTHRTCYLKCVFFFKFCSGSPSRALIKLLFLQNWCLKIVKNIRCNSLTMILTIYYKYNNNSLGRDSIFCEPRPR